MAWTSTSLAYARTHADPLVWFDSPDDVAASRALSGPEKLDILRRWHRRTRARAVEGSLDERTALVALRIVCAVARVDAERSLRPITPCAPGAS